MLWDDRRKKFCGSESGFQLVLIEDRILEREGIVMKRVETFCLVENIRKGGLIVTTIRPLFSSGIVELAATSMASENHLLSLFWLRVPFLACADLSCALAFFSIHSLSEEIMDYLSKTLSKFGLFIIILLSVFFL